MKKFEYNMCPCAGLNNPLLGKALGICNNWNTLGLEGWELVTILNDIAIFKRELSTAYIPNYNIPSQKDTDEFNKDRTGDNPLDGGSEYID